MLRRLLFTRRLRHFMIHPGLLTYKFIPVVHSAEYHRTPTLAADVDLNVNDVIRSVNTTWLRENCQCPKCFSRATSQRKVTFYDLRAEQKTISDVQLAPSSGKITIQWADGHVSEFDPDWLSKNLYPGRTNNVKRQMWDGAALRSRSLDRVPCEELINENEAVKRLIESLVVYGVGIVGGVEPTVEATQAVVERVSFIEETLYGRMWSFTSDMARQDLAYTNVALGAHTDTTYLTRPAGIQVFHCTHHDGNGGETLLVDGFKAAQTLRLESAKAFDTLCNYRVHHENKEGDMVYLKSLAPILSVHPATGQLESIRYNHNDRSPISTIPQHDLDHFYRALAALSERITDPEAEFWMKLVPGTVLFIDNWRVLHGRAAFTGTRCLCGCYLPRDEWMSKARAWGMVS